MRISFEIPPENFSAVSQFVSCELKRKVKAWEFTNATPILTYLLTQANGKSSDTSSLDSILANIHYALSLYGTRFFASSVISSIHSYLSHSCFLLH
jgi:pantothenate kinase-related protein Tda10